MRPTHFFFRCCLLAGVSLSSEAIAQETRLQYVFDPTEQGSRTSEDNHAQQLKRGWDDLWGKGGGGSPTGQIGVTLPPPEVSRKQLEIEKQRGATIQQRLNEARRLELSVDPTEIYKSYILKNDLSGLFKYRRSHNPNDLYVRWKTTNAASKSKFGSLYYSLDTYDPKTPQDAQLAQEAMKSIRLADTATALHQTSDANFYYSLARTAADILVGIDPITGTARSAYEALTGYNLITGAELSPFERGLAVFGCISFGYGSKFGEGLRAFGELANESRVGTAAWEASLAYATHFEEEFGKFSAIGGSSEEALVKYASILREAADGPRLRMEALAVGTEDLGNKLITAHTEKYLPADTRIMNLPRAGEAAPQFTRAETAALGQSFVGPNPKPFELGYLSQDGRYQYRTPALKPDLGKVQANLEIRNPDTGRILSNYHIDVKD